MPELKRYDGRAAPAFRVVRDSDATVSLNVECVSSPTALPKKENTLNPEHFTNHVVDRDSSTCLCLDRDCSNCGSIFVDLPPQGSKYLVDKGVDCIQSVFN